MVWSCDDDHHDRLVKKIYSREITGNGVRERQLVSGEGKVREFIVETQKGVRTKEHSREDVFG